MFSYPYFGRRWLTVKEGEVFLTLEFSVALSGALPAKRSVAANASYHMPEPLIDIG